MKPEDELESFAGGIHLSLAVGHALAAIWNYRRRNGWQVIFHILVCAFEVWASLQHRKEDHEDREA